MLVSSSPDTLESGNQIMRNENIVWHIQNWFVFSRVYTLIKTGLERKKLDFEEQFPFFFFQVKWSLLIFVKNLNLYPSLACGFNIIKLKQGRNQKMFL